MTTLTVMRDPVADALDDMAALGEHWKRNRDKGRTPSGVRQALLLTAREVLVLADMEQREIDRRMAEPCNPEPCVAKRDEERMMDIVERLRTYSITPKDWEDEAADEIERLRIDVAFLAKLKEGYEETIGQLKGEADRLRAELKAAHAMALNGVEHKEEADRLRAELAASLACEAQMREESATSEMRND